jgi:DNA-binding CsgD family transcriptional regulator
MEIFMNIDNSYFNYEELDKEIINFVIFEKSNKEIAEKTGYSIGTIKFRLSILFKQHGVKTKAGLVREIFQKNLFLSLFKK